MHILRHPRKRQDEAPALPSVEGASGVVTQSAVDVTGSSLALNTGAPASASFVPPPLAENGNIVTITQPMSSTPSSSTASASATPSSMSTDSGSSIPIGTVIGACVGAFAGLGLLLCLYIWCGKRPEPKARNAVRRASAYMRSNGGDQQRTHTENWTKLDTEGAAASEAREMEEKNFSMFKKSPSMYSKRTVKSDEDHGTLPPFEFSKYHPHLAEELSQPQRPYVGRQESTVSWDGETVGDDSFLSLRSVRPETGTMSPTVVGAKMTPPATSCPIHRWESAEVLTMEEQNMAGPAEVHNPFADAQESRTASNPFFNAREMQRQPTRSRSNSRTSRSQSLARSHSRSTSFATVRGASQRFSNPFMDIQDLPATEITPPPPVLQHGHNDSVASGASGNMFGAHAMRSLIAALDLTQEEVEERLRAASMRASMVSGMSGISGVSGISGMDDQSDIATVREFPMPPQTAHVPH